MSILCILHISKVYCVNNNTTTTVLWPFVQDYPGEPVPEETLTHPPSWSSPYLYQLLPSTTIHSILPVQIACLAIFLHNLCPCPLWSTCWSEALHLIFHNFCFAVVSILYHLFLVFLSTPYLVLYLLPLLCELGKIFTVCLLCAIWKISCGQSSCMSHALLVLDSFLESCCQTVICCAESVYVHTEITVPLVCCLTVLTSSTSSPL